LETATIDGGIQAGADDRLPGHPLRHLAPVAVAQLRQFDVVWIERFARRVLSAFIWNTASRENGSEEPFMEKNITELQYYLHCSSNPSSSMS
ncbi:MAG: hypothetical protein E7K92_26270, partial [Serratia marcescens]|nr:hypothetical protein [Serratia marcescens]